MSDDEDDDAVDAPGDEERDEGCDVAEEDNEGRFAETFLRLWMGT